MRAIVARWRSRGALIALLSHVAHAHKPSDSYLTLKVDGERIDGQWDIALRDLDYAISLDANQDGEITWGEVKAKHARDRRIRARSASPRTRRRALSRASPRAADRQPQRRRVFGAALHRDVRGRAEDARRRLRIVLRPRPAASRPAAPRTRGPDARRHLQRRRARAALPARRAVEVGAIHRLRQGGRLAHLDRVRPRALPAVAAVARGARPGERSTSGAGCRRRASRPRSGTS